MLEPEQEKSGGIEAMMTEQSMRMPDIVSIACQMFLRSISLNADYS